VVTTYNTRSYVVFQRLTGLAPAYLADDCQLSTRRLRSTDIATCAVRRSNNSFGDRCFAAAGARVWNMLPIIHLRLCDRFHSLNGCSRPICLVFGTATLCDALGASCINHLTYLLTIKHCDKTAKTKWTIVDCFTVLV